MRSWHETTERGEMMYDERRCVEQSVNVMRSSVNGASYGVAAEGGRIICAMKIRDVGEGGADGC